jgi:DNA-binding transcriptional regulator PaaX
VTARGATRKAILAYLRVDDQPVHIYALIDYMSEYRVTEGAVRNQLLRLVREGQVERVERNMYRARVVHDDGA